MHSSTTKALLACVENGGINTTKFFQQNPLNESLMRDLVELKDRGYIALDFGDNRIDLIGANQKLLDLLKEDH
jgi:hypothetical protein